MIGHIYSGCISIAEFTSVMNRKLIIHYMIWMLLIVTINQLTNLLLGQTSSMNTEP